MTSSHADHDHDNTKAARAACRKALALANAAHQQFLNDLLSTMPAPADSNRDYGIDWLLRGASAFTDYRGSDRTAAAEALITYFGPSGDEAKDAGRRRNGYTITTSASTIRSTILRRHS